ncbi:MAG: hypothetical protein QHH74_11865 [Spirochaetota bacterium]|nr:hypothetical protein [Spirochaetota bacterium]
MATYNTIKINNHSDNFEEYIAAATILPGSLIELTTDNKVKVHSTAGGNVGPKMFALEDAFEGKGIDDAYAADDRVRCWFPAPGDVVLAILADGQKVDEGDFLESNGAGYLRKHTPEEISSSTGTIYSNQIVAISLEQMDAIEDSSGQDVGGGLGGNKRIRVRIV